MNEELIKQIAREVVPFVDEPGTGEQNYRYAAAVMAIETYHARAVAPLVEAAQEFNEALFQQGLVAQFSKPTGDAQVALHEALAPFQQEGIQ